MPKKGGKSTYSENIQPAKEVMRSIINLLEAEFSKLGDAKTMTPSQFGQITEEVNVKINQLDDLMAIVRRNGAKLDDEYKEIGARASDLILRLESYSPLAGGKRRRKTRRAKSVRRK
jgi:methyl-accepting chemotaxis protein